MSNLLLEKNNVNNPTNISGMSMLFNNELLANSIKPDVVEKNLIDNSNYNDYQNNEYDRNPIAEYENQVNDLIYNNSDISNIPMPKPTSNFNTHSNENDYINTDDVISEFDEFDQLLKSVSEPSNNNNNNDSDNDFAPSDNNRHVPYGMPTNTPYQRHQSNYSSNIDNIINSDSTKPHNSEINKTLQEDEKKMKLLEQIDMLKEDLKRDGINLRNVNNVDFSSSLDEIDHVYRILLIKNNRDRYRELAEDCVLTLSAGLERIFDGENEYFGMQPDLTGYSDVVKAKLRRLRYETSTIASNVMEKFEFTPLTRICIELLPSAFIHSTRRKKHAKDQLNYENQNQNMDDVLSSIRDNEDTKRHN